MDAPAPRTPEESERKLRMALAGTALAYGLAMVALAASGHFAFFIKGAVLPALLLLAWRFKRLGPFLRDWVVFLTFVLLFDAVRGLIFAAITKFQLPWYARYAIDWERALLGGETLPTALQAAWLIPGQYGWLEKGLVVVHGSHFVFFMLFGLTVWIARRAEFWRYKVSFLLTMALGLCIYYLVPTVPPWMAAADLKMLPPVDHVTASIYNVNMPSLRGAFDVNPIAAMPSLHTAFPTLCTIIGLHHFGRRAWPMVVYTLLVMLSIGYLGEHYLVDILAGVAVAGVCYLLLYRVSAFDVLAPAELPSDERPEGGWRRALLRPVLIAALLVLATQGIGSATIAMRTNLLPTRDFVERELVGISEIGHLMLAESLAAEDDHERARRAAVRALTEVRDPRERRRALGLIDEVTRRTRDAATTAKLLEALPAKHRDAAAEILLARALAASGQSERAVDRLELLATMNKRSVEARFWRASFALAAGRITPAEALAEADAVAALDGSSAHAVSRSELLRQQARARAKP